MERKIKFTEIINIVSDALDRETNETLDSAASIFSAHKRIYDKIYLGT